MTPVVCLITDRARVGGADGVVDRVRWATRAGVHLVQVRERDLDGGPLTALVRRCVEAVRGSAARVLVNDRLDVALAAVGEIAEMFAGRSGSTTVTPPGPPAGSR